MNEILLCRRKDSGAPAIPSNRLRGPTIGPSPSSKGPRIVTILYLRFSIKIYLILKVSFREYLF